MPSTDGGYQPQRNEDEYLAGRILPPGTYPGGGNGHWQSRDGNRASYHERPRPEDSHWPRPRDGYPPGRDDGYPIRGYDDYPARGNDGYPPGRDDRYPPRRDDRYPPHRDDGFAGQRGHYGAPTPDPSYPSFPDSRVPPSPDPYYDGYRARVADDRGAGYGRPGYDRPAYDHTAYDRSGYDRRAYDRPANDRSFYDRPAYDGQAHDRPANERHASGHTAPGRTASDRGASGRPASDPSAYGHAAESSVRPGPDGRPRADSWPERPAAAPEPPAGSARNFVPQGNEIAVRAEQQPADRNEDDTLTRPLPVILPGATSVPRPEPVEEPRGPFEPARPTQAPVRPASITGSVEPPPTEYPPSVPPPLRALPQPAAAKLDQLKDLYLTAEAIGPDALDKHFDQVSQRQRELIKEFFERSDTGDAGAGRPQA